MGFDNDNDLDDDNYDNDDSDDVLPVCHGRNPFVVIPVSTQVCVAVQEQHLFFYMGFIFFPTGIPYDTQ